MPTTLLAQMMKWLLLPYRRKFLRQLQSPAQTQSLLLKEIVQRLARTEYGKLFRVDVEDDYADFAKKVPLVTYDKIRHWIERQRDTERSIITNEPILFYEKTVESSGSVKYFPYTLSLKRSFYRMFAISFGDILLSASRLSKGMAFASISPHFTDTEQTKQGHPLGFEDDSEYLDGALKSVMSRYSIIPPSIKRLQNPDDFKYVLSVLLLAEPNLEIISIWNPSFLETILEYIEQNKGRIISVLQRGELKCEGLTFRFKTISEARVNLLMNDEIPWQQLWPHLKLISCWTGVHTVASGVRINSLFFGVRLQSKGLISTEAPMTIALTDANGYLPFVSDVFFEFIDDNGKIRLLHELELLEEYEVVITQKGGLYRYRVGDRVKYTHSYLKTPCLQFVGRTDSVCDLVGEKLNEIFVRGCIEQILGKNSTFSMLLPTLSQGKKPHYCLVLDQIDKPPHEISKQLDDALCKAFHYRNARKLGQLHPAQVRIYPRAKDIYFEHQSKRGVSLTDIKISPLFKNPEQAKELLEILSSKHA